MLSPGWSTELSPEQEGLLRNSRELWTVPRVIVPPTQHARTRKWGQWQRRWAPSSLFTHIPVSFIAIPLFPKLLPPLPRNFARNVIPPSIQKQLHSPTQPSCHPRLRIPSVSPTEHLSGSALVESGDGGGLISLLGLAASTQPSSRYQHLKTKKEIQTIQCGMKLT